MAEILQDEDIDYTDVNAAKEFFIKDRFAMVTTGIDIIEVNKNYARCKLVLSDAHKNAVGAVMGGAIFTLADFTFAVATNFRSKAPTVTLTSSISYISSSKGKELFSDIKLIKDGRKNCFFEITITDDLGATIAIVNTTGAHL